LIYRGFVERQHTGMIFSRVGKPELKLHV
jgi:hypothetical protein